MLKQMLQFLPIHFAVILSAVALPVLPNVEFNFEVILYITIFVSLSSGSCPKLSMISIQTLIQNSLESTPIIMFLPQLKELLDFEAT